MKSPAEPDQKGDFWGMTSWTLIKRGQAEDPRVREQALNDLLTRYRPPILLHIQHQRRCSVEEAEDLTQSLMQDLFRHDFLSHVAADKGRFRSFLRQCIANFLRDTHDKESALKRGGGQTLHSLDEVDEEGRKTIEPAAPVEDPGVSFDLIYAHQLIEMVLARLEAEYQASGKGRLYQALHPWLTREVKNGTYPIMSQQLGMSEGSLRVALSRLRRDWKQKLMHEIRDTVQSEEDFQDEVKYLVTLISKGRCALAEAVAKCSMS